MVRGNNFLYIWIICLLPICLVACVAQKPTPESIVGLWVERRTSSKSGDTVVCASFKFSGDGRFEARDIPREYFVLLGMSPTRIDATGSWRLDTSSKDPFAWHRVNLAFDPIQGFPLGFDSYLSAYGGELFAELGEGNRITFVKRDKAGCE